jgi:hypothetical protein
VASLAPRTLAVAARIDAIPARPLSLRAEAVAQTRLAPVCLWFDHKAGSFGVEAG